jgi:hypothetical protein
MSFHLALASQRTFSTVSRSWIVKIVSKIQVNYYHRSEAEEANWGWSGQGE